MANKSTFNQHEKLEEARGQLLVKFLVKTSTGEVSAWGIFWSHFLDKTSTGEVSAWGRLLQPAVEPFADYVRKHLGLS